MKIINGADKEIILEENDSLIISTLNGNKIKIYIRYKNNALIIDDIPFKKLEYLKEEEKAIKAMKTYKRRKKSNQNTSNKGKRIIEK